MNVPKEDLAKLSRGNCPACGSRGFVIGPQGGKSMNVECASITCRARFNVVWYSGVALTAHTLPPGGEWPSEPRH